MPMVFVAASEGGPRAPARHVPPVPAAHRVAAVDELAGGIRRVTLPLPARPGHVHAYLLPGDDGWTVVDTGLGLPTRASGGQAELDGLPGPVARIVVTHFHPDHVGARPTSPS